MIAEDYYGNDYPEDEVGSDDEYGRGAYTYRKYGSDDEDFDQGARTSSDEEGQTSHPWKHNFGNSQLF